MNKKVKLLETCTITTGKLDSNAGLEFGEYPFFTCAPTPARINDYAFDSQAVLIAGNNAAANFHVSRYTGKFNAYQRTYVLVPKSNYDLDFLYYVLKLELQYLKHRSQGSQTKFLTMPLLTNLEIPDLSLPKQRKTISALKLLDEKIDLLTRKREALAKLAVTLFNYWFVQFNFPDANGEPYSLSGGKMKYSKELEKDIPEKWESVTLGRICDIYQPKTISGKEMDEKGKYQVYGSNGIVGRYKNFNHEDSEVVVSCRGDCGNVLRTRPNSWITGNAMVFKPLNKELHNEFILHSLRNLGLKNSITGSVQGQLTRKNVENLGIVLPDSQVLKTYCEIVSATVEEDLVLDLEIEKATSMRDFLLPQLINGHLKISATS